MSTAGDMRRPGDATNADPNPCGAGSARDVTQDTRGEGSARDVSRDTRGEGSAPNATRNPIGAAAAFRELHRADRPLLLPNAWDFGSAAALVRAGFTAVGTTSLGVAVSHGVPDGHGLARAETLAVARRISRLPCLLSVDVEGGFSADPQQVAGLAAELAGHGVAGINLEDGRADGTLADPGRQCEIICAIRERTPELFVNARTDTYWLGAGGLPETLDRARRYVAAGADGVFVPGLTDPSLIGTLVGELAGVPLNVLHAPQGPPLSVLAALGVRRVSCGSLLFRAALAAAVQVVAGIADDVPPPPGIPGYAQVAALVTGQS